MRRPFAVLIAVTAAGCAGHSSGAGTSQASPTAAPARQAAAPAGDPTSLRYVAGANRYRISTEQHTAQEMMGQTQNIDITTTQVLTITLAQQGDSLAVTATVDSMDVQMNMPEAQAAAADAARAVVGKSVSGYMNAQGRMSGMNSADTSIAMQQVIAGVRDFFLLLPGGALTPGRTWTDTVTNSQALGPMNMRTQSIRNHQLVGWEMKDGARALHILSNSAYTVSGSGEAQGQPLDLSGSGHVTMDRWISNAGVYLGLTEADSADMNVNVTSMGMSIPVKRAQRATVTRQP